MHVGKNLPIIQIQSERLDDIVTKIYEEYRREYARKFSKSPELILEIPSYFTDSCENIKNVKRFSGGNDYMIMKFFKESIEYSHRCADRRGFSLLKNFRIARTAY